MGNFAFEITDFGAGLTIQNYDREVATVSGAVLLNPAHETLGASL